MRRVWAGIGQAIESAAIAAVGVLVCALVLLLVWGVDQGFGGDPLVQWRIAADAWLLGHGVDIGVALPLDAVGTLADGRVEPFVVTLGAWGIGALTFWLHWRCGRRLAQLHGIEMGIGTAASALATGGVGALVALSAQHGIAAPNVGQAFVMPALVALAGVAGGVLRVRGDEWLDALARVLTLGTDWLAVVRSALRMGLGGALVALGGGALVLALGLALRFVDGILLLEALSPTHVGVVVLFLVQLALLPIAIVWSTAWTIGPGFEFGSGSSVSPLGTDLGPVPTLPLLAAIDPSAEPWMLIAVALPVLAGIAAGVFARQSLLAGRQSWLLLVVAGAGGGLIAGALLGVCAALSTGAVGPGRLGDTGPDALLVFAWGALELAVGMLVGLFAGSRDGVGPLAGGFAVSLGDATVRGRGATLAEWLGLRARDDDGRAEGAESDAAEDDAAEDDAAEDDAAEDDLPGAERVHEDAAGGDEAGDRGAEEDGAADDEAGDDAAGDDRGAGDDGTAGHSRAR